MDGEHAPCDQGGHDDDGDEAVDHGLLASSIVRLATVAPSSARILIGNRYAPLPQRGEGEAVLHTPASRPWENSGAGLRPHARRKHHGGHKAAPREQLTI